MKKNRMLLLVTAGLAAGTFNLVMGAEKEAPRGAPPAPSRLERTMGPATITDRKLSDLRAELHELEKAGNKEAMEKVRRQISEVERDLRPAMRPNHEPMELQERLRKEIEELHRLGRHEEAERLARERAPDRQAMGEEHERTRHLAEAIEHLRLAGMPEAAENLEREMARRRPTPENPMSSQRLERLEMEMRSLQESVRNVNRRLEEVGERLKKEGR